MTLLSPEEEKRYTELQAMALDFARSGETNILEQMIKSGLSVDLADDKGNTLLMLATYNGQLDTTRMLLRLGAKVDQRNDRGQTPLGGVAFKGYLEICKELVKAGAQIDADNGGGKTPIMFATLFGRVEVVAYFKALDITYTQEKIFGFSVEKIAFLSSYIKQKFTTIKQKFFL